MGYDVRYPQIPARYRSYSQSVRGGARYSSSSEKRGRHCIPADGTSRLGSPCQQVASRLSGSLSGVSEELGLATALVQATLSLVMAGVRVLDGTFPSFAPARHTVHIDCRKINHFVDKQNVTLHR